MFHVPEEYRMEDHPVLASDESYGNNGAFKFHWQGYDIYCIASDGTQAKEAGVTEWEHVSVHINRKRTPTWEVMCKVKNMFWDEEDCVIQFHPPKSEYVNRHPYVLHLWRKVGFAQPLPENIMV